MACAHVRVQRRARQAFGNADGDKQRGRNGIGTWRRESLGIGYMAGALPRRLAGAAVLAAPSGADAHHAHAPAAGPAARATVGRIHKRICASGAALALACGVAAGQLGSDGGSEAPARAAAQLTWPSALPQPSRPPQTTHLLCTYRCHPCRFGPGPSSGSRRSRSLRGQQKAQRERPADTAQRPRIVLAASQTAQPHPYSWCRFAR